MDVISKALDLYEEEKVTDAVKHVMSHVFELEEQEQFSAGELLQQWGFLTEAKEIFENLLRLHPNDTQLKFELSDIYIDLEMDEEALSLIEDIEPESPDYVSALMILADIYQSQGLHEVAEQKLWQAKELQPDNELIDFGLAELAFYNGEYQKAINFYEKVTHIRSEIPFVDIFERLAECHASIGQWEKAMNFYQEIELNEPDPLFKYGYTAFQLNRFDIAIKAWNDLLDLDPDYTSVYTYLAKSYEEEGLVNEANDVLKKGLSKDEYNIDLYITLAKNELKLNRIEYAKNYLKEAISLDPGHEKAIRELFNIYEKNEEWDDAKKLVEEIKKFEPYPEIIDWKAAQVYNELEEYNLAKQGYEKALLTYHHEPGFLKEYGLFLVEEGQVSEALKILKQYIVRVPEDQDVEELITRLQGE